MSKLPTNTKFQKSYNLGNNQKLWSMMHTKLKDGKIINIYIPQNPNNSCDEEVYSYTKISGEQGRIVGQSIYYSIELGKLFGKLVTPVSENGKIIGEIVFGNNINGGVKGTYKNLKTNVIENVIFKPGYENL